MTAWGLPQPQESHVFLNLLVHLKVPQVIMALISLVLWHISCLYKGDRRDQGNLRGKQLCVRLKCKASYSHGKGETKENTKDELPCKKENLKILHISYYQKTHTSA